ncbi:MAG: M23 family metallopeptidase [Comamonadaceae bacterium]|nr:MAG: M23 family metallopeptidase [Comamonadaceae bacterium]
MPETPQNATLHPPISHRPRRSHAVRLSVWLATALLLSACASTKVGPGEYRVKSGDTLTSIARANGQTVAALMRLNGLTNPNVIEVGQVLKVGAGSSTASSTAGAATTASPSAARPRPAPPPGPTAASIALAWPADGKVVRSFNGNSSKGIDIANNLGTPVTAAAAGTVAYVGDALRNYGNLVIVRHTGNYMTIYAHNRKLLVKEGQTVKQGDRISEMGTQTNGKAALYFEVRAGSQPVDPMRFLPAR